MTVAYPKPPPEIEAALAALARGQADGWQQHKAITWLVGALCGVHESPFVPDNDGQSNFNMGRQWVGLAFLAGAGVNLVALPHLRLREEDTNG